MRGRALLLTMISATMAIGQTPAGTTGGASTTEMATPPPVSGMGYSTQVRSEMRSNYLRGGVAYTTSYIDNFMPDSGKAPIAETTISVMPTIEFDTTTTRQHVGVTYSPGFTFYRPSSALNQVDNTAAVE